MQSFRDAELQGWDRKARHWDDTLGAVTPRAIEPLLDAVGAAPGVHLLDMACGTGALAAEAAWRGAEAVGTDFAPTMIAEAVQRHPGLEFRVGDAELHMERPGRVLAEIARVLRPAAGRFAMTAWTSVGEFFALVGQAVQAHADTGVPLPPAPPIFRLGDETSAGPPCSRQASPNPPSSSCPSSGPAKSRKCCSTSCAGARCARRC